MATSLAMSTVGPVAPVPAHADNPPDPVARLQFIIHKLHIIDDTDLLGGGEESFFGDLCADSGGPYNRSFQCGPGGSIAFEYSYDASSGDDINLERVVPEDGDFINGDASADAGLPVYAGQHYILSFDMFDRDPGSFYDTMGDVFVHVDEEHNWGIGTFTARSIQEDGSPGDYDVTFEIRRAPLPDLLNRGIHIVEPGANPFYCDTVSNIGEQPIGPSPLTVKADGTTVKTVDLKELAVGESTDYCVLRSELPAQEFMLSFTVDEQRQIAEMDETNNFYEWKIPATTTDSGATPPQPPTNGDSGTTPSPQPKPAPKPKPSSAQPDLTVRAIQVNGQAPDGKNACTAGKSDLTVVIKNDGSGDAGSFTTRLAVDDKNVDATVDSLGAGQEQQVHFNGVSLTKGQHTLRAVADPDHAVTEAKDGNNALRVTVSCKDG